MTGHYYNEHDPAAAAWLRELIAQCELPAGDVDERDIQDVRPSDLDGYAQCHFFAGIGGWPLALRLAGWPEDRPVWTGSPPCQPFSAAGGKSGFADERHLWPHLYHLISECRPSVFLGEQVASKDGLGWLDLVQADMEGAGYAFGALDLCSAGIGAPHIRQRLHIAAVRLQHAKGDGWEERRAEPSGWSAFSGRVSGGVGDCIEPGLEGLAGHGDDCNQSGRDDTQPGRSISQAGNASRLADSNSRERNRIAKLQGDERDGENAGRTQACGELGARVYTDRTYPTNGVWRDADWLHCTDGKWRPVESGTFPLAHGVSGRVGLLRGYGNAINPHLAAAFIEAVMAK